MTARQSQPPPRSYDPVQIGAGADGPDEPVWQTSGVPGGRTRRPALPVVGDGRCERLERIVAAGSQVFYSRSRTAPFALNYVSDNVQRVFGWDREALLADPERWTLGIHPDDRSAFVEGLRGLGEHAELRLQYRARAAEGPWRWVRDEMRLASSDNARVREIVGAWTDVSAEVDADGHRRESEVRFRRLFESGLLGVVVSTLDGRVLEANDEYLRIVGCTRDDLLAGRVNWASITPPEWRAVDTDAVEDVRTRGVASPREKEYFRPDGSRIPVLFGASSLPPGNDHAIAFVLDQTERRNLQEQLRHAQKMEEIGHLAGGVAHDFNNLLTVILAMAGNLVEQLGEGDPLADDAATILRAGESATSLTRHLLAFSRKQPHAPRRLNLNVMIQDLGRMLTRLLPETVELTLVLAPDLANVHADASQLEQVVVNLAVNSRDAMPGGGKLTFTTTNIDVVAGSRAHPATVEPGTYVLLSVHDTGVGMDAATQSRIFEPFFTTKPKDSGTGLGLSTVYGIVRQHGGSIFVRSAPGEGATFHIYLPRSLRDSQGPSLDRKAQSSRAGRERILLVDDASDVRRAARRTLERRGYDIVEATDTAEALQIVSEWTQPVDLVLTDIVMPAMDGIELARRMRALRPDLRVLFMSGYSDTPATDGPLISKPFSTHELLAKVREVLDAT